MGRDGWTGLVILVASLALFWATLGLERHPMVPVGPGFYPRLVLGGTALMALALLVGDVLARRRAGKPAAAASKARPAFRPHYGLVVGSFGIFAAYVMLLPGLGFRIATFAFMVAMQAALETPRGLRAWILLGIVAIATTAAAYYAFEHYLQVLLPRGRWTDF